MCQAVRLPLLVKLIGNLWLQAGPVLNHGLPAGSQCHVMPDIARYHGDVVEAIR